MMRNAQNSIATRRACRCKRIQAHVEAGTVSSLEVDKQPESRRGPRARGEGEHFGFEHFLSSSRP